MLLRKSKIQKSSSACIKALLQDATPNACVPANVARCYGLADDISMQHLEQCVQASLCEGSGAFPLNFLYSFMG